MLANALYISFVSLFVGVAALGHVLLLTAILPNGRTPRRAVAGKREPAR
jgi:hypothetical protein